MSEEYTLTGGRLVVDRPEHKESIDLDLSEVTDATFTRGVWGDGALVLCTEDGEYIVRLSDEDGPDALAKVRDAMSTKDSAESTKDDEPDLLDLIEDEQDDEYEAKPL